MRKKFFWFAALVLFFSTTAGYASAATFVVNTTEDIQDPVVGDGICGDGVRCSLRAAIQEANALDPK